MLPIARCPVNRSGLSIDGAVCVKHKAVSGFITGQRVGTGSSPR